MTKKVPQETAIEAIRKQSLYRAYRPKQFGDIAGQDQIVRALEEQVRSKGIGHAYLFAGSRGLGKTSIARIFAGLLGTTGSDLYEIDAASNNSVDDIRALTENVYTLPFESEYKVYLLDEAHMLSKSAWNAFLKTLEEPPAHAVFILATTELEKVPDTVQSRCQVFTFKKPSRSVLHELIRSVAVKEGYGIEAGAADLIALLAGGSYRDALSVLQRVIATSSDKKITRLETEQALGAPSSELVHALLSALGENSLPNALGAVARAESEAINMKTYLELVLDSLRSLLLLKHAPDLRAAIEEEIGSDRSTEMKMLAAMENSKLNSKALVAFLDASERIRTSPVPAMALEVALYEVFNA